MVSEYTFTAKVWKYEGHAGWHFITLPKTVGKKMSAEYGPKKRGWGSIPVTAQLGMCRWQTSIFPDSKSGTYIMGLKAEVRKKEHVQLGNRIRITLAVRGVVYTG